ncbi:MAG TPA: hypothetical protein VED86_04960 [archaeon]|nr:hypothetical protein [archaeon]
MADHIVSGHQTTVDKLRNHGLVTVRADLLLRVEKTEAYIVTATQPAHLRRVAVRSLESICSRYCIRSCTDLGIE